jgi:hypothetical protein
LAVQTITYDDKTYINQNADIPDINKCNDTDLNEIKAVVNNNATEVQNIEDGLNLVEGTFSSVSCTHDTLTNVKNIQLTAGTWIVIGQFEYNGNDLRYFLTVNNGNDVIASSSVYDKYGIVAGNVCGIVQLTGTSQISLSIYPNTKTISISGFLKAIKYQ